MSAGNGEVNSDKLQHHRFPQERKKSVGSTEVTVNFMAYPTVGVGEL